LAGTEVVMNAAALLAVTLALPLAMLSACASRQLRDRMPALLALAPLPALAAALLAPGGSTLVLPQALLGLTFVLDRPGAMLLGAAALLWTAAGAYAGADLRGKPNGGRFAVWWLMTLTGNLGVFMAADMVGFYLFFSLVSLAAYGLVVHDDTRPAKRAAAVYIALAVLGEAFLLMGLVLAAASVPDGSLLIGDAVAALSTSPWRDPALALLVLGFGLKIGLVPLHVWMPLTYSAAPIPAAAVLSGAAVKAGVIGLIRFLPFETALPGWGEALVVVGLVSAFYGVAIGLTQTNSRTVLAYSSVSQMGLLAAVLGMGLAAGDATVRIAAAFYAVHHVLVKGGLFLAAGTVALTRSRGLWPVLLPAALLALGLGGLPLTGGGLAKLAIKAQLGDGVVGMLGMLSAIASTLLMLHFLRCLRPGPAEEARMAAPAGLVLPWLAIAFASVAVPWALFPAVANETWQHALAPKALWEGLWPVLIGGLMAFTMQRFGHILPRIPAGDVLAVGMTAVRATRNLSAAVERIEGHLRQWPVVGVVFLALTIILAGTLLAGR
jgi:formate hydrogenlyase subunit 3/multisubunit Na+/H+ antiporter MnhD subunit